MKNLLILLAFGLSAGSAGSHAAARNSSPNNKVVAKLQTMVKEISAERDAAKSEKNKLVAEIEKLKKEKAAAASDGDRLSNELSVQKSSNAETRNRLEQTHAKLLEVIEKYKELNKEKTEADRNLANLATIRKMTETELQSCEGKNIKMFEAAKDMLNRYENHGVMDALFKSEPFLKFKSVEMEAIVQEYEDKLIKQKYLHKDIAAANLPAPESE